MPSHEAHFLSNKTCFRMLNAPEGSSYLSKGKFKNDIIKQAVVLCLVWLLTSVKCILLFYLKK